MIVEKTNTKESFLTRVEDQVEKNALTGVITDVPNTELKLSKGEFFYQEDDLSSNIYLIESGSVKIAHASGGGNEVVKNILGPGNFFGEKALAGEEVRLEYAQAINPETIVKVFHVNDIMQTVSKDERLSFNLLKILGKKLISAERRIESIISKDSRTRIVDFLKDMALENGKKVGFETLIKNNFTHKDIASLTGTSRQTVTTTLNSLKDQNIINFDRRRILIRDMELLK